MCKLSKCTDLGCVSQGSAVKMNRRHLVHHLSNALTRSSAGSWRVASSVRRLTLRTHRWHFAGIIMCEQIAHQRTCNLLHTCGCILLAAAVPLYPYDMFIRAIWAEQCLGCRMYGMHFVAAARTWQREVGLWLRHSTSGRAGCKTTAPSAGLEPPPRT